MNLQTNFLGVLFRNPLVLASGVLGMTAASLKHVVANGAGGVTTKSIWLNEHQGHPGPVMIANEYYMLNAVGVPDAGMEKAKVEIGAYLLAHPAPLIANIIAGRVDDYGLIAEQINALSPDLVEVNISCPNVEDELGKPFACSARDAARVTQVVRAKTRKPISIKLSPNVLNIVEIAKACVDAGADAITAINTVGPGMKIDIETREPVLANKAGGMSGPAIKPIAIKAVYDIHKAFPNIPIIGTGGVIRGEDAIEMIMAGATLVGMGTAVYYRDVGVFGLVAEEIRKWCNEHGVKNLDDIRGAAHRSEYSEKLKARFV